MVKNPNKKRGGTMTRARIQILSSKCPPLWLEIYRVATGATPKSSHNPNKFPPRKRPLRSRHGVPPDPTVFLHGGDKRQWTYGSVR